MATMISDQSTEPTVASRRVLLQAVDIRRSYGDSSSRRDVLADVNLTVEQGRIVCVVGPAGCGKTTLLRCLTGRIPLTSGRIFLDGGPLRHRAAHYGFVFQDHDRPLLSWLKVLENVTLPMRSRDLTTRERTEIARETLDSVGLAHAEEMRLGKLPADMQQRVAIARSLAMRPQVLVLDEPFAEVDARTRANLEDLLLRLHRSQGLTVLLATRDIDEAVYLGDKVVALSGPPAEVAAEVQVDLGEPRDQTTTRAAARFAELRGQVTRLVRASVDG